MTSHATGAAGILIDVHHHILPARYVAAVGAGVIGSQGSSGRIPAWSIDGSLKLMDQAGISAAVTSVSSPGLTTLTPDAAIGAAREVNEFAAEMTTLHPGRFGMFATVPLRGDEHASAAIDASIDEARHALDDLGADGVCLLSNYHGRYLGDRLFSPLHEYLQERTAVVFVHPTSPVARVDFAGLSPSMLEFPFETTRTAASLLMEGAIARSPRVRWIFSHAGGALPYLIGRLEVLLRNNPQLHNRLGGDLYELVRTLYFDTALSADATHIDALLSIVPPGQVLFGSDYPFGPPNQMIDTVERLAQLDIEDDVRSGLGTHSADVLFPRFAESAITARPNVHPASATMPQENRSART